VWGTQEQDAFLKKAPRARVIERSGLAWKLRPRITDQMNARKNASSALRTTKSKIVSIGAVFGGGSLQKGEGGTRKVGPESYG